MLKKSIYSIIFIISASIYADNDQYVLLVLMDGFRADYLEKTYTPISIICQKMVSALKG